MTRTQKVSLVLLAIGVLVQLVGYFSPAALVEWATRTGTPPIFSIIDNHNTMYVLGVSMSPFVPLILYMVVAMFIVSSGKRVANQGGMTLVELMLVMVVIAIMASFAFAGIDRGVYTLRTAANSTLVGAQFAKVEAIKRNTDIVFGINPTGWAVYDGATLIKKSEAFDSKIALSGDSPAAVLGGITYAHTTQFNSRGLMPIGSVQSNYEVVYDGSKKIEIKVTIAGGVKMLAKSDV